MRKDWLLAALVVAGSALCWWPWIVEPSLDLPVWLPFVLVALLTGLSSVLSGGQWLRFVVASAVGTYAGLWGGFEIWWPRADPIAGPWVPVGNAIATLATVLVSLLAGFAMRRVSIPNGKARRAVWIAFACCFAFGPVALALTPPLVAFWITRNERAAVRRVESLREAVERVVAETGNPSSICDGQALERAYSGPRFSKNDWLYIVGNYVKQDGYLFSIYCHEKSGFTIAAFPARDNSDGVRHFCTDRSGKLGCGLDRIAREMRV